MVPKAFLVCLLLLAACAAPPAPPENPRTDWTEKTRAIRPSWGRKELEAFLDAIRVEGPHRTPVLQGGGYSLGSGEIRYYDLYSLDETSALYVVWNDLDVTRGSRSTQVVGFPDLRGRIDPDLFEAVAAINRSPSATRGIHFDPVLLIRAVNLLQALGREKALKALWAYDRLLREASAEDERKYQLDEYRLLPIVQLLFESSDGKMPAFTLGTPEDLPPEAAAAWPLYPIVLVQDVPLMMIPGYPMSSKPQRAADHLRLNLGPLRAPLAPRVTALEAVDELIQSAAWASLRLGPGVEGPRRWQLRRQAFRAVSPVFAPRPEETTNDCCVDPTETQWRATVGRAGSSGLMWSPELQDFILGR